MQVGVIGINHKLADLKLRETLAKVCERRFHPLCSTHGEQAFILLSTCNRTEIYFSSNDLAESHSYLLSILRQEIEEEFDHKLYSYFRFECFYHLSRVTAGLDSACVAETEIQGQVKAAYELTQRSICLTPELHFLFQKALHIGKQIRSELNLGRGLPELEDAILETATDFFTNLNGIKILFVGASNINEKILSHKKLSGIHLMTRSTTRAQELESRLKVKPVPWNPTSWTHYDWILFGTKAPDYLIEPSPDLSSQNLSRKLVMDLSVPRNVNPSLARDPQITLLNIDQLNRLLSTRHQQLHSSLAHADRLVTTLTERHHTLFHQKRTCPLALALSA